MELTLKEAQGGFFDRRKVIEAVAEADHKALSKFGAFVRQRARSSIRKRKRISAAGDPPSSHTGVLRKLIFFAYDRGRHSVVIGPTQSGKGEAPRLLEHGGDTTLGTLTAHYRARPFMGPAFAEELKQAPELWRDSIKR